MLGAGMWLGNRDWTGLGNKFLINGLGNWIMTWSREERRIRIQEAEVLGSQSPHALMRIEQQRKHPAPASRPAPWQLLTIGRTHPLLPFLVTSRESLEPTHFASLHSFKRWKIFRFFNIPYSVRWDWSACITYRRKFLALFCQPTTQRLENNESRDRYLTITPHSIFATLPPMGTLPNSPRRVGHCQATRQVHGLELASLLACLVARLCFLLGSGALVEWETDIDG